MIDIIKKFHKRAKIKGNNLSPSDLWVLVELLSLFEEGMTELTDKELAKKCGLSLETTQTAKRKLKDNGLIDFQKRKKTRYKAEAGKAKVRQPTKEETPTPTPPKANVPEFVKRDRENPDALHYKEATGRLTIEEVKTSLKSMLILTREKMNELLKEEKISEEAFIEEFYNYWTVGLELHIANKKHANNAFQNFINEFKKIKHKLSFVPKTINKGEQKPTTFVIGHKQTKF